MYEKIIQTNTVVTLYPVCKLEEETMHCLVACNVNMSFEGFQKVHGNESCDIEH